MNARVTITIPVWLDKICAWPVVEYRRRKFGYPYRRISLGEGKFTIVDPQDFYRFNIFNWCPNVKGTHISAFRLIGTPDKKTKIVSLHREIMNHPSGFLVDHRNGDALDNRRDNLRKATQSENQRNRAKTTSKTASRFKGVRYRKDGNLKKRWLGKISINGKQTLLGYFLTEEEAARAYDEAAKKYYGEFARLNFPEPQINTDKQK